MKRKIKIIPVSLIFIAGMTACQAQSIKTIGGVFRLKTDTSVRLIIKKGKFTYIDSRKNDHLATLCCDTITYGDVSVEDSGLLLLRSDRSLNSMFVGMDVVESTDQGSDSVLFNIHNPIEDQHGNFNSKGGELTYKLLVEPVTNSINYFRENNQPFETGHILFYNPNKLAINGFTISINPNASVYVKNLAVHELSTMTYNVKKRGSNVFDITIPQLSYGFISYKRIEGDFAKLLNHDTIIWQGREFVRTH